MRRFLIFMVVYALSITTTWAQRSDVNGDGIINSADVVCVYNDIINGVSGDVKDEEFTIKGITFKMIWVKGGTFQMGATIEQEDEARANEKPVHSVTLNDYYIGETEVTQALWQAVMDNNPSDNKVGGNYPVENVSWLECQLFITTLSALLGKQFRMPTESEWEYACRGGSNSHCYRYSGSNNADFVAWNKDNSKHTTHPVASKQHNELGIYDMSGNVEEFCQDWEGNYSSDSQTNPKGPSKGEYRIARGGSFLSMSKECRSTYRSHSFIGAIASFRGLRLALTM